MKYDLGKIQTYVGELDKENVLNIVNQDDVLRYYLGFDYVPNKLYLSPLRKERNPSFAVYYTSSGEPRFKDFNGSQGTCFDLVMLLYNADFYEALQIINRDMRLGLGNGLEAVTAGGPVTFESFKSNILNSSTVANASPDALCLFEIGIPKLFTKFPSLYDLIPGISFFDN